ncbi:hypothetical protein BJ742DRAFT_913672 [Cladochytrium replicatum]|nr:hypothetical protein BJ742DRAFT_913672 [Cladochytrium replicatum]
MRKLRLGTIVICIAQQALVLALLLYSIILSPKDPLSYVVFIELAFPALCIYAVIRFRKNEESRPVLLFLTASLILLLVGGMKLRERNHLGRKRALELDYVAWCFIGAVINIVLILMRANLIPVGLETYLGSTVKGDRKAINQTIFDAVNALLQAIGFVFVAFFVRPKTVPKEARFEGFA